MGFALGVIRLSYDDFCRLTVDEYKAVAEAYSTQRETEYRDEWERMRMLALITVQPHVKKGLTAKKLLPFPWDKRQGKREDAPTLTTEQQRERMRKLVEKLGDKMA